MMKSKWISFIPAVLLVFNGFQGKAQEINSYDPSRVPYRLKNGNFIYVDSATMQPLSSKEWERAFWFDKQSNLAPVMLNGKWGIVNEKEEMVIPFDYDYADVVKGDIFLAFKKTYSIRNQQLEELMPPDTKISSYYYHPSGYIIFQRNQNNDTTYSLMDWGGKILIPFARYDGIVGFPNKNLLGVKHKGYWGLADTLGNLFLPCIYEHLDFNEKDTLIQVQKNGKWGFIDRVGRDVVPAMYQKVSIFSEGLAAVKKDGHWGYIDQYNTVKIPFLFNTVSLFVEGIAAASIEKGTLFGLINSSGNWVIQPVYEYLSGVKEGRIIYREKKRYGIMDATGQKITLPIYDDILPFSEGLSLVTKIERGKKFWGFIDRNGNVAIPFQNYLKSTVQQRLGSSFLAQSYMREILPFHHGFSSIWTYTFILSYEKNSVLEYYMDRAGRKYAKE
jgi:hypothetical protein